MPQFCREKTHMFLDPRFQKGDSAGAADEAVLNCFQRKRLLKRVTFLKVSWKIRDLIQQAHFKSKDLRP